MIYETPKSVLEQRLNEALGTDQEKTIVTDLMHLSLLKKAQLNTDDLVYDEMFKLLGLETFSDLISLLDGRTVTFPTRDEFRDTLMTVLCYYYRNVEGKDWAEIRDILGVQDLNAIKEGIRASQFESFHKENDKQEDFKVNDLETLVGINNRLASTESQQIVEAAQIHNPPKEVQNALTGFITSRLEKIENDGQFEDLIKLHIRQRLPEASFDQLIRLQDMMSKNNTHATDVMNKLFRNETSGKTVIEHLRDNDVSSTAAKLYDSTDSKDVLQAVTYLGSIISKIQESNNIIESPLEKEEE